MRKDLKKDNLRAEGVMHPNKVAFAKSGKHKLGKDDIERQKFSRKSENIKGKDIDLMNYTDL